MKTLRFTFQNGNEFELYITKGGTLEIEASGNQDGQLIYLTLAPSETAQLREWLNENTPS